MLTFSHTHRRPGLQGALGAPSMRCMCLLSDGDGAQSSFRAQASALVVKNAKYQKRNIKTNCCLVSAPVRGPGSSGTIPLV